MMKKLLSKLILTLGIVITITLMGISTSQAATFNFAWNGSGNYLAKGLFSYNESTAPATFSENGPGKTHVLQSLNISFFDPLNNLIASYNNVMKGISNTNYFKFNFNTVTQEIFGSIDLGGEVTGEIYLSGTINNNLSLFQVPQSDSDLILDTNSGDIVAKTVPEPSNLVLNGIKTTL
ncbi:hypothetical protein [Komarekiella delphini-convector]|nr:hypothetical protein [Komarekiella delphini-convector]